MEMSIILQGQFIVQLKQAKRHTHTENKLLKLINKFSAGILNIIMKINISLSGFPYLCVSAVF